MAQEDGRIATVRHRQAYQSLCVIVIEDEAVNAINPSLSCCCGAAIRAKYEGQGFITKRWRYRNGRSLGRKVDEVDSP